MKSVGKLGLVLLALSLFASPLMACLLPNSALTDEERECCRQMAGDCGQMPSSHSCCRAVIRDSDPYVSSSRVAPTVPSSLTIAVLPLGQAVALPARISLLISFLDTHSPPQSPPKEVSILRI
jgi:hypothetical protein